MSKDKALWTSYRVTWDFPGKLCGQVPKNPELVQGWLDSRKPTAIPPNARSIQDVQAEVVATLLEEETLEEQEKRAWLGFQMQEGKLVMRGATVRAHFKDCGRIVGRMYVGKIEKEAGLGWKITNGLYVEEYWLPILRGTEPVLRPDGYMDKAVHAQTPRGPMNALKRIDFINQPRLVFTLRLLCGLRISDIETIMQYGAIHGYAGERSEGEGRYIYTIEPLEI